MNNNLEEMIKEMKEAGYTEEQIVNCGHINVSEMVEYLRHKPLTTTNNNVEETVYNKTMKFYEFRCPKCQNIFIPGLSSGISAYNYLVQLLRGMEINEVIGKCPTCKEYVTATKDKEQVKVKTR